jgi:hypothetical protein
MGEAAMRAHRLLPLVLIVVVVMLSGCPPKPKPVLGVSASEHDFGTGSGPWTFTVWNSGGRNTVLNFTLSVSDAWIQLNVDNGSSTGAGDTVAIQVTVNTALLAPGVNTGAIEIVSNGGGATIAVTARGPGGEGEGEDDLLFIHHSVGDNWLSHSLRNALLAKTYVDEVNEITYGTDFPPDTGRPDSLAPTPGDLTDMHHWIRWFNDYIGRLRTHGSADGENRIVLFKSCFPNSNIEDDGDEPGDPFIDWRALVNYRAVYRHPEGPGNTYNDGGRTYRALEDVFAANPNRLFIAVTAPPLHYAPVDDTTNANAARAPSTTGSRTPGCPDTGRAPA